MEKNNCGLDYIDNYKELIGHEFIYKEMKVPILNEKDVAEGVVFYKPEYDFLCKPERWSLLGTTSIYLADSNLYHLRDKKDDKIFVAREIFELEFLKKEIVRPPGEHFRKLVGLSKEKFEHSKFEEVMGVFLYKDIKSQPSPILYHTYSAGITFGFSQIFPKPLRKTLEKKLAQAIGEINRKGIDYVRCQPTNIRYDAVSKKIIFSPHRSITFEGDYKDEASDIAIVLYTHDWIEDFKTFLDYYCAEFNNSPTNYSIIDIYNDIDFLDSEKREDFYRNPQHLKSLLAWLHNQPIIKRLFGKK